ncbi:MAG: DUF4859 domain-containing protein, partial [Bacteroidaceae bacterium]|nr:DUF4859 domain-containing protein [Bacteroidaceae bacterium]
NEEATPLSFVAADNAGQYYLHAKAELSVGRDGGNTWTMSTAAEKRIAWSFTALGNGEYHINNLVTAGRFVGTNANEKTAGTSCYCDKQTSNGNVVWIIEEYVAPVPTFAGIIEQTLSLPNGVVMGTETSEQTVKIAEAGEGLVDITFSGFKFPAFSSTIPEFTISNVATETAADGSITYAADNFQVVVPPTTGAGTGMGMAGASYNGTLEGVQASAEATPLFKLVLQTNLTNEIYFGADQDAIDAYKASLEPEGIEIAINVERIVNQGYAAQTESCDFTEVAELLGVDAITEDMLRVVEVDGTLNSDIAQYDGWFNKDGYAETWAPEGNQFVCVKLFQAIENGEYEICDMNTAQVGDEVTAKWAAVNGEKTVYININVKFIEKPVIALTFDDLNKLGDDVVVPFTSECGKNYEELTGNVDMAGILATLGVESISDVDIYAVQSNGSLDDNYKLGTTDGWRNADGDWQSWGADARFCVKVNFAAAENQIYYVGGMEEQNAEPADYTATFAFVKKASETHDAVVLKVTLTYDYNVSIDGIDAAKAKANGKYLQNGKIVIVKNGKTYSVSGVEIK